MISGPPRTPEKTGAVARQEWAHSRMAPHQITSLASCGAFMISRKDFPLETRQKISGDSGSTLPGKAEDASEEEEKSSRSGSGGRGRRGPQKV